MLVPEINGRLHGGRIAGSAQARTHGSETRYWVDVTATQTIHLDLAEPKSCPTSTPWC